MVLSMAPTGRFVIGLLESEEARTNQMHHTTKIALSTAGE